MGVASLAVLGKSATLADVQTDEVKEKPRLYRYESYWVFLRVHGGNQKVLAPALVDGILVGCGDDENQMYSPEGCTPRKDAPTPTGGGPTRWQAL